MTGLGAQRAGLALMLAFSAVACEQDRRERQAMFWQQRIAEAATEEQRDALAGLALKTMTEQEVPR